MLRVVPRGRREQRGRKSKKDGVLETIKARSGAATSSRPTTLPPPPCPVYAQTKHQKRTTDYPLTPSPSPYHHQPP